MNALLSGLNSWKIDELVLMECQIVLGYFIPGV